RTGSVLSVLSAARRLVLIFVNPLYRHSRKNKKNQKQKTEISSFPRRRESRSVGTETYREKRFFQP
ncbi:hypothetical protein C1M45_10605, partial [Neisseria gonorrhoeae]